MKKINLILSFIAAFSIGAVAQNHHQGHGKPAETRQSQQGKADPVFQKQLTAVAQANFTLGEALVQSDFAKASNAAKDVQSALKHVDMKLLEGQAHAEWMAQLKALEASATGIATASKLDDQRKAYAGFSQALYQSLKQFGINSGEVYYQYCPMALNNKGAYWISDKKEIQNPYFGEMMLKCGTTKEIIN